MEEVFLIQVLKGSVQCSPSAQMTSLELSGPSLRLGSFAWFPILNDEDPEEVLLLASVASTLADQVELNK